MADFLFELGCEELPSGLVESLAEELRNHLIESLNKAKLSHGIVTYFATPRRLAVYIENLVKRQPEQTITRRGPLLSQAYTTDGHPTPAAHGFAKSCGVSLENLQTEVSDKGECLTHSFLQHGMDTAVLLPSMIEHALSQLTIPKPMRWGNGDITFARPVQWVLMMMDEAVIDGSILGMQTNRLTFGHRFHHPEAITIQHPHDYEPALQKASVVADFTKRKALILQEIENLAITINAKAIIPAELLQEVTSIVEWPQALLIDFEHHFLRIPHEALIAAMQVHQKCFALQNEAGELLPHFITIANIKAVYPNEIIAGNAKVMRARLSDAVFFYEQDSQCALADYYPKTEKVVFQQKLGTLADKSIRMQGLMVQWAAVFNVSEEDAVRAAYLSKCDLMTGMVNEFPELQGLMGYYYAKPHEQYAVAEALQEQYYPRFSGDILPRSSLGSLLSLADRMDILIGIFGIGQKPSAVKDPFKLRRHALAVIRLLAQLPEGLSLSTLIQNTITQYGPLLSVPADELQTSVSNFIFDRLTAYYQAQGISADKIKAVAAVESDDMSSFHQRLMALNAFVERDEIIALAAACKRVNNVLLHQSLKRAEVQVTLFQFPSEHMLYAAINPEHPMVSGQYEHVLESLSHLQRPVDDFFTEVMVMVEDDALKNNRLALLYQLQKKLQSVADISLLNG